MSISKFMNTWIKRSLFRGLSIQQRLPLLICVLLLCVMIVFSYVSYIGVKNAALKAGRERLNSLSDQLGSVFSQSAQVFINATRITAQNDSIIACLKTLDSNSCIASFKLLETMRQDTMSVLVDILDAKQRPIVRSSKNQIESNVNFDSLFAISVASDTGKFGRIFQIRDSAYYSIAIPIKDKQRLLGYLVRWRIITANPKSIEQFSQLIGTNAQLYVGNADGSLWTNMIRPIPNPIPGNYKSADNLMEYSRGKGNYYFAAQRPINNTKWSILVEFSQKTILETANRFLAWIIIIGTILLFIGIFIAWIMSRNITRPLNKLTEAASAIAAGNSASSVAIDRKDELGKLARAFNAMTVQVHTAKQNLEQKIIEAGKMNEQLRELSAHLQNIREQERIHIAREMHDELGQLLTGFKMDVAWLNKKLNHHSDPSIQEKLESLIYIVDEAVSFVRKLAAELRPSILDDLGLIAALEWHSKEFQKRFNIEVDFQSRVADFDTPDVVATGLFRMYQESLTNVARHSEAKKVVATLQKTSAQICLSITDDGKGFEMNSNGQKKTLGLLGMKERAVMIGGKLEIVSRPGNGTTVIITVPSHQTVPVS